MASTRPLWCKNFNNEARQSDFWMFGSASTTSPWYSTKALRRGWPLFRSDTDQKSDHHIQTHRNEAGVDLFHKHWRIGKEGRDVQAGRAYNTDCSNPDHDPGHGALFRERIVTEQTCEKRWEELGDDAVSHNEDRNDALSSGQRKIYRYGRDEKH